MYEVANNCVQCTRVRKWQCRMYEVANNCVQCKENNLTWPTVLQLSQSSNSNSVTSQSVHTLDPSYWQRCKMWYFLCHLPLEWACCFEVLWCWLVTQRGCVFLFHNVLSSFWIWLVYFWICISAIMWENLNVQHVKAFISLYCCLIDPILSLAEDQFWSGWYMS